MEGHFVGSVQDLINSETTTESFTTLRITKNSSGGIIPKSLFHVFDKRVGHVKKITIEDQGWYWPTLLRSLLTSCRKTVRVIEFEKLENIYDFFSMLILFEQLQSIRFTPLRILDTVMVKREDVSVDFWYYPRLLRVEGIDVQTFLLPRQIEASQHPMYTMSRHSSLLALLCINEQKMRAAITFYLCFRTRYTKDKALTKHITEYILRMDSTQWYLALTPEKKLTNPDLIPCVDPLKAENINKNVNKYNTMVQRVQNRQFSITKREREIEDFKEKIVKRERDIEKDKNTIKNYETKLKKAKINLFK